MKERTQLESGVASQASREVQLPSVAAALRSLRPEGSSIPRKRSDHPSRVTHDSPPKARQAVRRGGVAGEEIKTLPPATFSYVSFVYVFISRVRDYTGMRISAGPRRLAEPPRGPKPSAAEKTIELSQPLPDYERESIRH